MEAIINFFSGLIDVLKSVIDYFIDFVRDLIYIVELTGRYLVEIPNYFSWLPDALITLLVLIFGIVVIYKILGREG